jgi:hypothetical protein
MKQKLDRNYNFPSFIIYYINILSKKKIYLISFYNYKQEAF